MAAVADIFMETIDRRGNISVDIKFSRTPHHGPDRYKEAEFTGVIGSNPITDRYGYDRHRQTRIIELSSEITVKVLYIICGL